MIEANLAHLARRPKDDQFMSFRSRALGMSEVKVMLEHVEAGPHYDYLAALVYAGMRAGEASALHEGDADLEARVIHVRRSCGASEAGSGVEQTPKSRKARAGPLPDVLAPTPR